MINHPPDAQVRERCWVAPLLVLLPPTLAILLALPVPLGKLRSSPLKNLSSMLLFIICFLASQDALEVIGVSH